LHSPEKFSWKEIAREAVDSARQKAIKETLPVNRFIFTSGVPLFLECEGQGRTERGGGCSILGWRPKTKSATWTSDDSLRHPYFEAVQEDKYPIFLEVERLWASSEQCRPWPII
jgi:hypothetical protein